MKPVPFYLGSLPVHSFGVMMALAFVIAGVVMHSDFARKNQPRDLAWEIVGFGLVGGLLGARLHQAVYHWPLFANDPLAFMTSPSGLVWYGGVLGNEIVDEFGDQDHHVAEVDVDVGGKRGQSR